MTKNYEIMGLLNNNEKLEEVKNYPEYKLFFLIDECNGYINLVNEVLNDNNMGEDAKSKFLESASKVREIRKNTADEIERRFGFKCYEGTNPTDDFTEWWNKWNDWRYSFSEEEWNQIVKKLQNNENIDEYL